MCDARPVDDARTGGPVIPTHLLNDGHRLPAIGLGTYPLRGADGIAAMVSALEAGYRLIDSAVNYENEVEVGVAVRASGLDREDILVTTKVPGRFHAKDLAIRSVEDSLSRMRLDVLDLVLIHWPNPSRGLYVEAWEALVECRDRGLVRSIGVSNFTEEHLDRIIEATGVTPAVNQVEIHPRFSQEQMVAAHERLGIVTESWSPLGKGTVDLTAEPIAEAARKHGVTPAQVVLRWHIERGLLPLPKSASPQRQRENLDIFGFELSPAQVQAISSMGVADGRRFDGDPDVHEEM
ncbi:MAG: aldo/keto reductase [Actinomycetales bacterium]|nr:aldo/keto reductase [Actinomycetales bacterium]